MPFSFLRNYTSQCSKYILSKIPNPNEEKAKKNDFPWKIISNCEMEAVGVFKFKHEVW